MRSDVLQPDSPVVMTPRVQTALGPRCPAAMNSMLSQLAQAKGSWHSEGGPRWLSVPMLQRCSGQLLRDRPGHG